MNINKLFEVASVRVRSAFVLAIAERALQLCPHHPNVQLLREALDACWRWVEGVGIRAVDLERYIEGVDGSLIDLASFAIAETDDEDPILQVMSTCVAYIAREACIVEGKPLSETIELATADAIEQVVNVYMRKMPGYDDDFVDQVEKYLFDRHSSAHPDELGPVVDRKSVLYVGGRSI